MKNYKKLNQPTKGKGGHNCFKKVYYFHTQSQKLTSLPTYKKTL